MLQLFMLGPAKRFVGMAIITLTGDNISEVEIPLLDDVVPCSVDFKSRPSVRSKSGYWKSATLLIGVEMAERFSYYGMSSNLISYFTGVLGQSTAAAAANLNAWSGTAWLSPIVGAFIADSFLGRYRAIIVSSLLYIMGLGFLSLSAALNSSSYSSCENAVKNMECSPTQIQKIFFFFFLYLVALAQGGFKPCLQAFGADQFDTEDEKEYKAKSSFFNWWLLFSCLSITLSQFVLSYIQENLSWELGFGIPCIVMCFSLIIFLLGSMTYRFPVTSDERRNPFVRIRRLFLKAARNCRLPFIRTSKEREVEPILPHDSVEPNLIFRLAPIWCTLLGYGVIYAQPSTLFTKQAATMERHITSAIQIPAATFQNFKVGSVVVFIPVYDRIFVPIARAITKKPSGISMLQRIGTGIFLSLVSIVVAAFVEKKRLAVAAENGMVDMPYTIVPMSVWWLVPQYMISGIADVFTMAGMQEFFYDQVPNELKTIGIALYISVIGIGISALSLAAYVYYAKSYVYRRRIQPAKSRLERLGMAITVLDADTPLLNDVVPGSVDLKNRPSVRSKSGCWKSASFIIGVEMAERFSYYGISSNLVSYLTGALGQSTASAAANLNAWYGAATLSPILGAFVADSFLGRYRAIIFSSLLYIMGLGFLSISAAFNSSNYSDCKSTSSNMECTPTQLQKIFFFLSLYLVALAQGGHKPCVQAFGADQFDEEDFKECKAKSSFFNWWLLFSSLGILLGLLVLSYIQENLSWELGFGIPCIIMCFALIIFFLGSPTYRFPINSGQSNPFVRISRVFLKAARRNCLPAFTTISYEQENDRKDVEDAKSILRLAPIMCASLGFSIVYAQPSTLFTKQAVTMDRHITPAIQIPAASFQSLIVVSIIVFIPLYDCILVPIARSITRKPSGISMLQRVGTGLFLSFISIVVAAFVEKKRLAVAAEHGLIDMPKATIPMSVLWLAPQYLISGIADVFGMVGLQEFFYDQVPSELKSMGLALYLSILGMGSFSSSILISVIEKVTGSNGRDGWFSDNLNRAHLDYFYWLLAGISAFAFAAYGYFAKSYVYSRKILV
ncbi:hypothetical protein BUALT_Bualt08G0141700 [Buddleja alternifolia]|uniref:Uncharacterized protein n=1 Tax=Buddleja alternifolia TaxID=168488 RepID=A0AAV6XEM8_9LAMI|nr:hypothetical protein BUALT_Bualt08G0141700 [Buddleja alternifolia]